jgi:hypothetical protein
MARDAAVAEGRWHCAILHLPAWDGSLFYMQIDDFDQAWSEIDRSAVNQRWQEAMAPLFEPMSDRRPGGRFPMMQEVFYLEQPISSASGGLGADWRGKWTCGRPSFR